MPQTGTSKKPWNKQRSASSWPQSSMVPSRGRWLPSTHKKQHVCFTWARRSRLWTSSKIQLRFSSIQKKKKCQKQRRRVSKPRIQPVPLRINSNSTESNTRTSWPQSSSCRAAGGTKSSKPARKASSSVKITRQLS